MPAHDTPENSPRLSSVVFLVVATAALANAPVTTLAQLAEGPPALTVMGDGEAAGRPDMAVIQVGVGTEAETARQALTDNTAAMKATLQTVSDFEVAMRDVQTSVFNISTVYARDKQGSGAPRIAGYRVDNQVIVKVRDLERLGELLDAVVSRGANAINGIRMEIAEPKPLLDQARRAAVDDARRKAELYAGAAGVTLGRILDMREQGAPVPPRRPMLARAMAAEAAVPIAAGESTVSARVVVTYEILGQ